MPPPTVSLPAPGLRPSDAASPDWVRRVVIAQWGRTYAEALQGVCARAFPGADFASCCSGGETLAALRGNPADVLLLALTFPDMDGVDLQQLHALDAREHIRLAGTPRPRPEQTLRSQMQRPRCDRTQHQ